MKCYVLPVYALSQHRAIQSSNLTVASGKFATRKPGSLPIEKVGRKKLLPGNCVAKVISRK